MRLAQLKVYLLGAPHIERNGAPVKVDTRKAIALLAYLAVTGASHSRDRLAALFWPDVDESHARAALRRTLSALNAALGGQGLEADREAVGLDADAGIWVDVDQFHRRLAACPSHGHPATEVCAECLGPLAEAAALYRDDFLAGFTLRDSPDFDDWQLLQTESLRRELASALERLVRCHSAQGAFELASAAAQRWLALDPLHEPPHRQLMLLYAWSGQRSAALRQYRECVRVLEQELGVPPLEETVQLYEAIQQNRIPPPPMPLQRGAPAPLSHEGRGVKGEAPRYPLVGRSAELSVLLRAYDAIGPDGHFIALEGEAGIGKTRLAEAFLEHVRDGGAITVAARCYEGEAHLAYGPFVEALRAGVGLAPQPPSERMGTRRSSGEGSGTRLANIPPEWLSEAVRLLPELARVRPDLPPAPPLDSPGAQSRFFEAISQAFLALCHGPPPGVVFLDDLHWADEASLDLLTYLVRRLHGRPMCLLATWRGENLPPGHRLRHLMAEAQRAGLATLTPLSRLSLSAVTELVRSAPLTPNTGLEPGWREGPGEKGRRNEEALPERLYRETEGLPFFLIEYLAMIAQGADAPGAGEWSLPRGVRALLHSRLAGVSETGSQLLSAAAVIGRSFDFDTLREASGRSEEEAVVGLEELTAQGLIMEVGGGDGPGRLSYDFNHEKLRSLVYEETSLARRRLLHRRVAGALVARARGRREAGPLAGQIAHHYRLAGQEAEAAEYFKLAGEHARSLYANAEALAHFRAALALGHPDAAALHEAIGDLHTLAGDYGAALASYETAAALRPPEALSVIEHKLGSIYHRRGDWDLAESHFQAGVGAQESAVGAQQAHIYADWSLTAHRRGQPERALDLARQALGLAEAAGDRRALAQAHNILGILASSQGDVGQARHHLEHSLALAEALGDPSARIAALNNLALACMASGERGEAIQLLNTALELCAAQGDRHREAALHNNLADLLHRSGQSEAAMAHLKQAVAIYAEMGDKAGELQPEIWKLTEW